MREIEVFVIGTPRRVPPECGYSGRPGRPGGRWRTPALNRFRNNHPHARKQDIALQMNMDMQVLFEVLQFL